MHPSPLAPRLSLHAICKRYGDLIANQDVDLAVQPGEIHALLGENGAGKSTLVKVVYGMIRPDSGTITWDGEPVSVPNPMAARRLGIGMVFQHFSLFETLTVTQNILLALPGRHRPGDLAGQIREVSVRYGLPVDPHQHVHTLSAGERQRVEIVRCLLQRPRLLIMDEPTSVLTPQAIEQLFVSLERLAAEGCAVLYISHKLEEIRRLCQRATVLRAGQVVATLDPRQCTPGDLATAMIGSGTPTYQRAKEAQNPETATHSDTSTPRLEVRGLHRPAEDRFACALHDIELSIRGGEILAIAGISGNGQRELLELLSGEVLLGGSDSAQIRLEGRSIGHLGPTARRRLGLSFVPEDRLGRATVGNLDLPANALLTAHHLAMVRWGFIRRAVSNQFARRCIERFDVRGPGPHASAQTLSGGNLQKFIVGREILQTPKVLMVSQPTWGVDVAAAAQIRQALMDLASAGAAVLVISEDLDELLTIGDRIAVLSAGTLSPARPVAEMTIESLGLLMGESTRAPPREGTSARGGPGVRP